MKTLIVCASRCGSTMEIGRWIAERLPEFGFLASELRCLPETVAWTWENQLYG
jgi:menaquinone-dependent protoporphyrinogen IX oxidase